HFVDGAESQLRHQFANLLGNHPEIIHNVLGLSGEFFAQHRILSRHTHWTSIEMADAHHDASGDYQRRGREAEFLAAQHGGHNHVPSGFELAVSLDDNPASQIIHDENLM